MPKKLSLQNAKKQVVEYMIYIITMVITVALLLSFNMIIFSEEIAAIINEKSILPLILITVKEIWLVRNSDSSAFRNNWDCDYYNVCF